MENQTSFSLIAGAILGAHRGHISGHGVCRKYRSMIQTEMQLNGRTDFSPRTIAYEITRAGAKGDNPLKPYSGSEQIIDLSFSTADVLSTDFSGYARKYSNFAPAWERTDLSGVVERISAGLALYTIDASISSNDLRGGAAADIVALGTLANPVTAAGGHVFVPAIVNTMTVRQAFAVIAAAANGCGSTVVTDIVALDPGSNSPIIPNVSGPQFAIGMVEALRILGANYNESGAGDIFSYAMVRGLNKVLALVGHSDEGGFIRSVLRCGSTNIPYGGVHMGYDVYKGLPSAVSGSGGSVTYIVDSIMIVSGALVAHCDPLIEMNGSKFPTIFSAASSALELAGTADVGGGYAVEHGRSIAAAASQFCKTYCAGLSKAFGLAGTSDTAWKHMDVCFQLAREDRDRHLEHPVVAPFFFVEPSTVIPPGFLGTEAEQHGYASLVSPGKRVEYAAMQGLEWVDSPNLKVAVAVFNWRSMRTVHLFNHLNGHMDNGLGATSVRQLDPEALICPGTGGDNTPVTDKMDRGLPLSELFWARGQSPLCAPIECANLEGLAMVSFDQFTMDDSGNLALTHLPRKHEFEGAVTYSCVAPSVTSETKMNTFTRTESRVRTRAATSLAAAVIASATHFSGVLDDIPVRKSAPKRRNADKVVNNPADLPRSATEPLEYAAPVVDSIVRETRGEPVGPTLHHAPIRAPRQEGRGIVPAGGVEAHPPRTSSRVEPTGAEAVGEDLHAESAPTAAPQ